MYRLIVLTMLAGMLVAGCQSLNSDSSEPQLLGPPADDEGMSAPAPEISVDNSVAAPSSQSDATGVTAPPAQTPGLALSSQQRFSDVPLPMRLKEDPEHSYIFESDTLQVGKVVYKTRATVAELSNFYLRECPAGDWKLDSKLESDSVYMVFLKPGKRLVVTIVRKHGLNPHRVLTLNLTPDSGAKAAI